MTNVSCKNCRFAEFRRTASGRFKREAGRCNAPLPATPTLLCVQKPIPVTKDAIWPDYAGQCDIYQAIDINPD
jgi:hypothetical protein